MVRSLLPLVLICLAIGGGQLRQGPDVRRSARSTRRRRSTWRARSCASHAAASSPQGLRGTATRPTSARTDAGAAAAEGDPVTLEIGYVTPRRVAGFVVQRRPPRPTRWPLLLDGAEEQGSVNVGGACDLGTKPVRLTPGEGEAVLSRESDDGRG